MKVLVTILNSERSIWMLVEEGQPGKNGYPIREDLLPDDKVVLRTTNIQKCYEYALALKALFDYNLYWSDEWFNCIIGTDFEREVSDSLRIINKSRRTESLIKVDETEWRIT